MNNPRTYHELLCVHAEIWRETQTHEYIHSWSGNVPQASLEPCLSRSNYLRVTNTCWKELLHSILSWPAAEESAQVLLCVLYICMWVYALLCGYTYVTGVRMYELIHALRAKTQTWYMLFSDAVICVVSRQSYVCMNLHTHGDISMYIYIYTHTHT